jgi:type II secretory pathway component PulC
MLPWIIQMSVISLILIVLVHYLFTFFKTNLTIPKVKDLVNKPQKQYEALFDTMKDTTIHHRVSEPEYTNTNMNMNMNDIVKTDSSKSESISMKNELKNYLKELSESKKTNGLTTATTTSIPMPSTQSVPNVNDMGGLLTGDTLMGGSFSSSSYSSY